MDNRYLILILVGCFIINASFINANPLNRVKRGCFGNPSKCPAGLRMRGPPRGNSSEENGRGRNKSDESEEDDDRK